MFLDLNIIMKHLIILASVFLIPQLVFSAKYIVFLTFISKSMKNIFMPIVEELVARGNTVTIVTTLPEKTQRHGIKEIILKNASDLKNKLIDAYTPGKETKTMQDWTSVQRYGESIALTCEYLLDHPEMQPIINGEEKYDVAIINLLLDDCSHGVVYKMGIPSIYVCTQGFRIEFTNNLRMPWCMSYCPMFLQNSYTDKMSFTERLINTFDTLYMTWLKEYYFSTIITNMMREKLDSDMPSVSEIERNVSLVIINDHFVTTYPRPLMPNVIQASGLHCRPAKPLEKKYEDWISGAGEAGFIYISFGTYLQVHALPQDYQDMIIETLAKLQQRVIWKAEKPFRNLPANVKTFSYLPQQDLLGDPRIRLFISHGGLLSLQEAWYHGVPVLGFPVSIDQPYNVRKLEDTGTGIRLKWTEFTAQKFYSAIRQLLTNSSYKENIKKRKALTQDLQNPPLDTAIFWIEYVYRHNGAEHLKPGSLYLSWYEYNQLDVWGLILGVILISVWLLAKITKRIFCVLIKKMSNKRYKKD